MTYAKITDLPTTQGWNHYDWDGGSFVSSAEYATEIEAHLCAERNTAVNPEEYASVYGPEGRIAEYRGGVRVD